MCTIIILLLATPLFYLLTKHYYAEDMIDIIEATQQNQPIPELDLEQDIMQGVMIQFALISGVLGIAIILMTRFVSKRLWKPFEDTLKQLEHFKLESETIPSVTQPATSRNSPIESIVKPMMTNSLKSYKSPKRIHRKCIARTPNPISSFSEQTGCSAPVPRSDGTTSGNDAGIIPNIRPLITPEPKSFVIS